MKKIIINNKTYNIPESWSEISLKQQIQVSNDSNKIEHESLKKIAILSGYLNCPIEILKKTKISDLTELFKHLKFINTPIPDKPLMEFDFKDKHYYVGQNILDSEFQDFISIENAIQMHSGNTYNALPIIIAVMSKCKKEDGVLESLDDYDVMARAKEFEDLPISIAHGLSVFFYQTVMTSQIVTRLFSNPEKLMEMKIKEVENMLKQSAGKGWLTRCVYGIFRFYLRSIKRKHRKLFTSTQQK